MPQEVTLSVCIPVLNEEKTLKAAVDDLIINLSVYILRLEIIIVDDGSTDFSFQIAEQIAKDYPGIKVIRHKRNLGIGTCYREALAIARGDYFTWFPADHENSAEEFIKCLAYLNKNTIVTCHHIGQDVRSSVRRFISCGYTWFLNRSFGLDLQYYNGLTIFPTSILGSFSLIADGFLFNAECMIKAIRSGCRIIELPILLKKRISGKTKALTFPSFIKMVRDLFRIFQKQLSKF